MSRRIPDALSGRPTFDGSTPGLAFEGEPGPFEIYSPDGYEPNYAYPLVVWFHAAGGSERELGRMMSRVSERNALGLALRGERVRRSGGFDWLGGDRPRRRGRLLAALRELRSEYHIHTERIVLAGDGSGAAAAASEFWAHPAWYGGLALFNAPQTTLPVDPDRAGELAGKPALLDLPMIDLGDGRELAGQLRAVGLDVTFQHHRQGAIGSETCRTLDRWLLGRVCGVPV